MNKITALRLYFHHSATIEPQTFFHKLSAPTVASHVMKNARAHGIEQVLVHRVESGYLRGDKKPQHRHVEQSHPRLPHCIELIDIESKLRTFWESHAEQLKNVRALFIPCDVPATS